MSQASVSMIHWMCVFVSSVVRRTGPDFLFQTVKWMMLIRAVHLMLAVDQSPRTLLCVIIV